MACSVVGTPTADGGNRDFFKRLAFDGKEGAGLFVPQVFAHSLDALFDTDLATFRHFLVAHDFREADEAAFRHDEAGIVAGHADVGIPSAFVRALAGWVRGHLHAVHVALIVESFPFCVLHVAGVGTEGDQAVVVEIALTPIPIVEAFEAAEAEFEELLITIAAEHAFDTPCEDRDLRKLSLFLRLRFDGHRNHVTGIFRCRFVPTVLEIPIV